MKGCYSAGGAPRMRNIGGVKAPAYGTSPAVMKEAKSGTTGKVGMDGIGADGVPIKSRMDRPGRKMGGRMKSKSKDGDADD